MRLRDEPSQPAVTPPAQPAKPAPVASVPDATTQPVSAPVTKPAAPPQAAPAKPVASNTAFLAAAVGLGVAGLVAFILLRRKIKEDQGIAAFSPIVKDAAYKARVPPELMMGIVSNESSWSNLPIEPPFDPIRRSAWKCRDRNGDPISCSQKFGTSCITSSSGAVGIAQVLPATAKMSAQQLCIPANSAIAGARYMRDMFNRYSAGNTPERAWYLASIAFNQGPGNVDGWIASGETSPNNRLPDGGRTVSDKGIAYGDRAISRAASFKDKGMAGIGAMGAIGMGAMPVVPAPTRRVSLFSPRQRFAFA